MFFSTVHYQISCFSPLCIFKFHVFSTEHVQILTYVKAVLVGWHWPLNVPDLIFLHCAFSEFNLCWGCTGGLALPWMFHGITKYSLYGYNLSDIKPFLYNYNIFTKQLTLEVKNHSGRFGLYHPQFLSRLRSCYGFCWRTLRDGEEEWFPHLL